MNSIKCEKYKDAFSQFEKSFELLQNAFEVETYENANEDLFKFMIYAGEASKEPKVVYFCSMILATSLNYFDDAYKYAYDFAKKVAKIEPCNVENWEWLLFFADIPDEVMGKKELEDSIISMLRLDAQNKKAMHLLNSKFTQAEKSLILARK